jgi:hypothetical protein
VDVQEVVMECWVKWNGEIGGEARRYRSCLVERERAVARVCSRIKQKILVNFFLWENTIEGHLMIVRAVALGLWFLRDSFPLKLRESDF